jgi:hypothetical protein
LKKGGRGDFSYFPKGYKLINVKLINGNEDINMNLKDYIKWIQTQIMNNL